MCEDVKKGGIIQMATTCEENEGHWKLCIRKDTCAEENTWGQ